jgi:hypothetical protein
VRASIGVAVPLLSVEDQQRQSYLTDAVVQAAASISKELGAADATKDSPHPA